MIHQLVTKIKNIFKAYENKEITDEDFDALIEEAVFEYSSRGAWGRA